jgi:hypothetical protein
MHLLCRLRRYVLLNVCPNCGGGFVARPVRPSTERRKGVSLAQHPASTERAHLNGIAPTCRPLLQVFIASVRDIAPERR